MNVFHVGLICFAHNEMNPTLSKLCLWTVQIQVEIA